MSWAADHGPARHSSSAKAAACGGGRAGAYNTVGGASLQVRLVSPDTLLLLVSEARAPAIAAATMQRAFPD